MEITLADKKVIQILGINLKNNTIDFKWVDGAYGGECSFPMEMKGIPTIEEIEIGANVELVTEEV